MSEFDINKGVGKSVEFKGLRSQYLILFALGIIGVFVLFIILRMINISLLSTFLLCTTILIALLMVVFHYNNHYGEHGLKQLQARKRCPRYIIVRYSMYSILKKS